MQKLGDEQQPFLRLNPTYTLRIDPDLKVAKSRDGKFLRILEEQIIAVVKELGIDPDPEFADPVENNRSAVDGTVV